MTVEQLETAGLSKEQAQTVLKLHKDAIDGAYVTKGAFDAEREKNKNLGTQVTTLNEQLTELGKFKGTAEELQNKVAELEAKNIEEKTAYEKQVKEIETKAAIVSSIGSMVYCVDDVLSKLDTSKIVVKEGKVESGLDDQMAEIKKNYSHYIKQESSETTPATLPNSWRVVGQSPVQGDNRMPKVDQSVEYGKALAKSASKMSDSSQRANEIYFK